MRRRAKRVLLNDEPVCAALVEQLPPGASVVAFMDLDTEPPGLVEAVFSCRARGRIGEPYPHKIGRRVAFCEGDARLPSADWKGRKCGNGAHKQLTFLEKHRSRCRRLWGWGC